MKTTFLSVEVFDENYRITLKELRAMLEPPQDDLIDQLLEFGLIEPIEQKKNEPIFDAHAIQRTHSAIRLQRDLHINMEGIALVLELLDELHELREKIKLLENH